MMVAGLDLEQYDTTGGTIIYGKLFPKLLKDFLTREDAKEMMKSSNLQVTTNVRVNPGQAVSAPPPSGAGSTTSPGTGSGSGQVRAIYKGEQAMPASKILEQRRKLEKELGTETIDTEISAIEEIAGV
jgi:hypothetical protein